MNGFTTTHMLQVYLIAAALHSVNKCCCCCCCLDMNNDSLPIESVMHDVLYTDHKCRWPGCTESFPHLAEFNQYVSNIGDL